MSKNNVSRRDFLLAAAAVGGSQTASDPALKLLEMMFSGIISRAEAQALGVKPRKYLFIPLMGGPARWTFTPLSPNPADLSKMIRNPMVNTRFTSATTMDYKTVTIDGIAWPWLWQFNVARAGSGMRPMSDLRNNMMIIRGILAQSNHGGQKDRFTPENIPFTLGSLVTDSSASPIPAINVNCSNYRHISRKNKSAVKLPESGNLLQALMDGLNLAPRKFHNLSQGSLKDLANAAQDKLENMAQVESAGFETSSQSLKAARETINRGFGDLSAVYTSLVAKYRSICERTNVQTLVGINDRPIGSAVSARGEEYHVNETFVAANADMRTAVTKDSRPANLAEHFALAEFALLNNLSDNIVLGVGHSSGYIRFGGLNFQNSSGGVMRTPSFDEHFVGSIPSLLANTFAHLCYGACLLELIDRLKEKNLFKETLIDLSGEMGRNPRSINDGSDHGGEALDVAMWCGAFDQAPKVVGDVLAQPPPSYRYDITDEVKAKYPGINVSSLYPGSWGFGASNDGIGLITHGILAATQAQILRVENPVRSARSIVTETNGVIKPTLPMGKIK